MALNEMISHNFYIFINHLKVRIGGKFREVQAKNLTEENLKPILLRI